MVLLLRFLGATQNTDVDLLDFPDITPEGVMAFLQHLETSRHNTVAHVGLHILELRLNLLIAEHS